MTGSEVYIELIRQGNVLKCTAVCAATGREASVVGPLHAEVALKALAVKKLRGLDPQRQVRGVQGSSPMTAQSVRSSGRGRLI